MRKLIHSQPKTSGLSAKRTILWSILVLFILKGLYLMLITPPWEAPDEPAHVGYILYLYHYRSLPSAFKAFIPASIGTSVNLDRSILERIRNEKLVLGKRLELFDRENTILAPEPANVGSHPPLYYLSVLPFFVVSRLFGSYTSLLFIRSASLLTGLGCLYVVFKLSVKLLPKNAQAASIITLLLALQPMFSFITSIINNDSTVVFIYLLFIFHIVTLWEQKEMRLRSYFLLALITALAPLVKPQLIIIIPLFLLFLYLKRVSVSQTIKIGSLILLPTLIWYLYNFNLEGAKFFSYSVQGIQPYQTPLWKYPIEFVLGKQPIGIFMSFWGFFGWLDVPMPKWTYVLYFVFIFMALGGWWRERFRLKTFMMKVSFRSKLMWLLVLAVLLYVATIILFDLQVFHLSGHFVIHGRYLAPVLPLLLIFLVRGLYFYPIKTRRVLIFLTIAFFVINQLIAIMTMNSHYYGQILPRIYLFNIYKI